MSDGFYTMHKLPSGSCWKATETCGGALLEPLQPPSDDLAKVRFSQSVFEVLKNKKCEGETIREAIERIILAA